MNKVKVFLIIVAVLATQFIVTKSVSATVPVGYLETANNTTIMGWAKDNDYSGSVYVHIYVDGTFLDTVLADNYRADLGGNYGFHYTHPGFASGNHTVAAYAIGVNSSGQPNGQNPSLNNSPRTVTVTSGSTAPNGYLETANNTTIVGWAKDNDYSGSVYVHIYVDGTFFDAVLADNYRVDLGGNYGFHYTHPPFGYGNHTVVVYAIGVNSSGQPNGQSPSLNNSPRSIQSSCDGYPDPSNVLLWCNGVSDYWINRQTDTKRLLNSHVMIGINNSYGGTIMQLSNNDRSMNLIDEHGGAGIQLSLYGIPKDANGDDFPIAPDNQLCNGVVNLKNVATWKRIFNPIQAQGENCSWVSNTNDVDIANTPNGGGWYTLLSDPNNFNRKDYTNFPGLDFHQTVTLGDIYAKVVYQIENGSAVTTLESEHEIPAIHTAAGVNRELFYADSSGQIQQISLQVISPDNDLTRIPISETQKWWSICNASGSQCVTIATNYQGTQGTILAGRFPNSGYATLSDKFSISQNLNLSTEIFIFPYRYDASINGQTVQDRINNLLN